MQEYQFKLNNAVLFTRIEEIKQTPPQKFLAYKAEHPEFRTVNCALLADYAGLSESTLKNLKLGKITDCNCSTAYLICTALDIDLRDLLSMPKISDCDPDACPHSKNGQDHSAQHLAIIAAQIQAASETMQQASAQRTAATAKLGKVIIATAAALAVFLAAVIVLAH